MMLLTPERRAWLSPLLHLYWRVSRGMTLGVRGCVVDAEGGILLVRHSYTPGWHFPGGGVEVGQTVEEALAVELREEAHVAMTGTPVFCGLYLNALTSPRDHVALFRIEAFEQTSPFVPTREILEARFFPREALPEGVTRGTRERIAELFAGRPRSPHW